jgi:hypothetical protein
VPVGTTDAAADDLRDGAVRLRFGAVDVLYLEWLLRLLQYDCLHHVRPYMTADCVL